MKLLPLLCYCGSWDVYTPEKKDLNVAICMQETNIEERRGKGLREPSLAVRKPIRLTAL